MKHLYHGSVTQNIKILEPRKRYTPQGKIDYSAIYATPVPGYAIAHSFPWSSDEGVGLDVKDGTVYISIPHQIKERLKSPVSLYEVSSESFEHTKEETTGYTWHATNPVVVHKEIKFQSVEDALKHFDVQVMYK